MSLGDSKFRTMMDAASKDTLITSDEIANMFNNKYSEVDLSIFSASEYEAIGLEHFLVEPEYNKNLVDGVFDFEIFHSKKFFNIEDFSGAVEYGEIETDRNTLHSNVTQEGQEEKLEFLDGRLQGADNEVLITKNGLPPTTLKEFLLDATPSDKAFNLDNAHSKESCLGNVGLESPSDFCKRDSCAEVSDMSSASILTLESTPLLEHMTVQELHETFKQLFGRETSVMDKQWLKRRILFGLQSEVQLDDGLNLIKCGVTSCDIDGETVCSSTIESCGSATGSIKCASDNENMSRDWHMKRKRFAVCDDLKISSSEVGEVEFCSLDGADKAAALVTQKRLRKPPKRYIEESLGNKSMYYNRKCGISYKTSKDRFLCAKSCKGFGAAPLISEDRTFAGNCIQVPFGLPIEEGHLKKNTSWVQDSEDCKDYRLLSLNEKLDIEPSSAESQDDISEDEFFTRSNAKKVTSRRKRHISWTPPEVTKLVEGVSLCGVGRWTEIKRLMFSSSSHRTSVDLKDKWRNLLRASGAQVQSKGKVKQGQKQASHQVPESVMWRVRELAVTYPYPR